MTDTTTATDAAKLKQLRAVSPVGILMNLAQLALMLYLGFHGPNLWTRAGGWFFAVLILIGTLCAGWAKARMHRKWLIGDRSVDRIRALVSKPTGLDGLLEVDSNLDEGSLMVGYHHAMRRVVDEIQMAAADVDAM